MESHVEGIYQKMRTTKLRLESEQDAMELMNAALGDKALHSDKGYLANKMRMAFRKTKEEGIFNTIMKLIDLPLTFLRDYTCPPNEEASWSRTRASVFPITCVFAYLWLTGYMQGSDEDSDLPGYVNTYFVVGLICILPGAILGAIIKFKTKVSTPPGHFLTFYAFVCFIMALVWIGFVCNIIMDLL